MSFCEAGHAVLAYYLRALLANEESTRLDTDPEALHQMRVATRRLRAALRDFRAAFSDQELDPFVRDIRWLGRLLGQVRDIDVLIERLRTFERQAPGDMRPYVHRIIAERELVRVRERAALVTALNSDRYHRLIQSFSQFVEGDAGNAHCDQDALTGLAVAKIERELERVRRFSKNADLNHPKRLHRLRIQSKRLRYTAEFFGSLFADDLEPVIKRARVVQDDLGAVHDSIIHAEFIKEVRRTQSGDSAMRKVLTEMIRQQKVERDHSFRQFRKHFKRLGSRKAQRKMIKRLEEHHSE